MSAKPHTLETATKTQSSREGTNETTPDLHPRQSRHDFELQSTAREAGETTALGPTSGREALS